MTCLADYNRLLGRFVLIAALSLVSSCSVLTGSKKNGLEQVLVPTTDDNSEQNPDARIGAKEHPKILAANGGAYLDAKLQKSLQNIVSSLTAHSTVGRKNYTTTILNSPAVNAFALPGGYIYVTRGLLALANDSAEIAAVMAHEMAHVSANHGIERSKKLEATKLADRVVLDVISNDRTGKIALAANKMNLAKFSRNQELQADALGIKMIGSAGFDPYAAARFLESMNDYARYQTSLADNSGEQDFLSTHPSTPRRIELAKRHARNFGQPGSGISNRDAYLRSIDGILFGDSAQEGYVRGRRFSHAGLGITFSVPTGYEISNNADAVVASGPNQIAVRFDGVSQPRDIKLDDYLNSGWVNGLNSESIVKGKINRLDMVRGEATADGWIFHLTLVRIGNQVYRFILAAPENASNAGLISQQITSTFRKLSRSEKKALKPLKLKVVRIKSTDTTSSLAARMQGVANRLDLFRLLNRLKSGSQLKPGQLIKIIVSN